MKIKKSLLGGLAFLLSSCVTLQGGLDIAYVPTRIDNELVKSELRVVTKIGGGIPINESALYASGAQTSFLALPNFKDLSHYNLNATRMIFDVRLGWQFPGIDFYIDSSLNVTNEQNDLFNVKKSSNLDYAFTQEFGVQFNF